MRHEIFHSVFGRSTWILPIVLSTLVATAAAQSVPWEQQLLAEGSAALSRAARNQGDATRGAIVFHRLEMTCTRCHVVDGSRPGLGPDLTRLDPKPQDAELVESVLEPSRVVRTGYESVTVVSIDGLPTSGLLVRRSPEEVVLRDLNQDGREYTFPTEEIDEVVTGSQSPMPSGLMNQLSSRQEFLDLVRYLIEIRDGGPDRARELRPPPSLTALRLPDYERHVDHAGLIRNLDEEAFDRGRTIYERVCQNCHGTPQQPGSLPTSLRFASDRFKHGSDPYTMYQTLTRGFGLMAPQTWMVPQQKYDVIHYVREAYLKSRNPSQYAAVDEQYLAKLPVGDTRGPEPRIVEPWVTMNYGPSLINSYEVGKDGSNFAQKGIAVRLDPGPGGISRGNAWMVFDHDTLRWAAAWTGSGFIDWNGIHFNGRHQVHPRVIGDVLVQNPTGPGWAHPETGSFADDARVLGRDGRRYGPLPRSWGRYRGLYHFEDQVIIAYSVADTNVLEMPGMLLQKPNLPTNGAADATSDDAAPVVFTRTINLGPRNTDLVMLVANDPQQPIDDGEAVTPTELRRRTVLSGPVIRLGDEQRPASVHPTPTEEEHIGENRSLAIGLSRPIPGSTWERDGPRLCLRIPAGPETLRFVLWIVAEDTQLPLDEIAGGIRFSDPAPDLTSRTQGGAPRWAEKLVTKTVAGQDSDAFVVDSLTHPENNPWLAQMRLTGLDFFSDPNRAAVCAWDGDVWIVSGLSRHALDTDEGGADDSRQLTWQRIASGLFQPLGVKIVDNQIFVTCRDQLVILRDRNGDGEIDFYECFNSDHQVTEHFHEFAMGLQVDADGNFYYAKSARHALPAVVPHHGTLLRVLADGSRTEIVANGFRAANGVCLNPDGTFVVTDQEGHWNPKNRINWVEPGRFYGNMFGYHNVTDEADAAMEQPLCWITNSFDRSPAELLWVPKNAWGPLRGSLINLSYGYGKIYVVPFEEQRGQKQGGMCALPIDPLPTGVMRGRFHPEDRQLYACGMFAWAGNATQAGGLYRIRYTGQPANLPIHLHARHGRYAITFTEPLDRESASEPDNYAVRIWSLRRTANYGSDHFDEESLTVTRASVSEDGRTVELHIPDLRPTWGMEVICRFRTADGKPVQRVIHSSIFHLDD